MTMRVLDLFSGIGGFSLGLERAGFQTAAFCEIEPYCRRVLAKHWPTVPCYDDVRTLTAARLTADGIAIELICGGFPCQDISTAGKGAGLDGARSGLWGEYARIIGELRPRYVIVENVAALLGRGLGRVLGDLAALGYDAEWHCIPASAVGAPHRRDRIWIIAYADEGGCGWSDIEDEKHRPGVQGERSPCGELGESSMAIANSPGRSRSRQTQPKERRSDFVAAGGSENVANAERGRLQSGNVKRTEQTTIIPAEISRNCGGDKFGEAWWVEPGLGRVAYGLPNQVDRLSALGNAVVPQVTEIIGRAIMSVAHNN